MSAETLLAAMLLMTPSGVPAVCPPPEQFLVVRDAIHRTAVDWEILDERETRYVLTRSEDFCADLNMLRRRRQELDDAPKVSDGFRFPDRNTVNELVRFNRAYRRNIDERRQLEVDRADSFRTAIAETDRLYQIWDAVRDARCDFYYVTVRRQALKKLRDLIGEEDYDQAILPPNVPFWRFHEMR